ncbi:phospholipase D-like domain-containing protein [Haloarchaeobius sp. DYHT-AS-18]|uniref:phospholipase D-like domain-containing protein n=1 Tax=Haloarchaeobius sp. DYHT-AS-18 TaxID=3446117 RepID=UPI003EC007CD
MSRTLALAVLVCLSLGATALVAADTDVRPQGAPGDVARPALGSEPENETAPRIVAVAPNPEAAGDRGEYVVVAFPRPTALGDWTLSDDEGTASLPNRTVSGRVAFTADPDSLREGVADRVLSVSDFPALANSGETVVLAEGGRVVHRFSYARAPSAETWTGDHWVPYGATDFAPQTAGATSVRAFLTPDTRVPLDAIRAADERVFLAGYTFTSARVTDALVAAAERGVTVRVLVDGGPVGGTSERQVARLDRLVRAGVSVRVLGGPAARYDFHHAKYAVADDRALVLTENWKPSGSGGRANRGWGIELRGPSTASLAAVFTADWTAHDTVPWESFRDGVEPVPADPATGDYPARIDSETLAVDRVTVLVAPDNAEARLTRLIRQANHSVRVEQMAVSSVETPLVRAAIAAARNGTRVRLLLSSAWYAEEENARVAARLDRLAAREGLDLDAKLVDPAGRFEKIHAKGVVVDRRHVVVGSVNWNRHSLRENREVAVVLTGDEIGRYYADAFDSDWDRTREIPLMLLIAAPVAAGGVAVLLFRKVRFKTGDECVKPADTL